MPVEQLWPVSLWTPLDPLGGCRTNQEVNLASPKGLSVHTHTLTHTLTHTHTHTHTGKHVDVVEVEVGAKWKRLTYDSPFKLSADRSGPPDLLFLLFFLFFFFFFIVFAYLLLLLFD